MSVVPCILKLNQLTERGPHGPNGNIIPNSYKRNRITEDMQTWTLKALEEGTINESEAEEIAEIVGFELTKEFELEVTVLYSVTVNARDEESPQNVIHDIDFDTVQYDSDNISWLSSSVDRIDI